MPERGDMSMNQPLKKNVHSRRIYTKCPKALTKNVAEDEVEINVDNISAVMFKEVVSYVNDCVAGGGSASTAKGKKVTTVTKRKSKGQ